MDDEFVLTFENFETVIDPEILERGRDYFKSGNVADLVDEDGVWTAAVYGTDEYSVEVVEDADGSLTLSCDCPYDWGPYCKHEAAVLYAIRAERKPGKSRVSAKKAQRQGVQQVVEKLTHEQLVEIVMEQVKKDKTLGSRILLRYGAEAPDKSLYRRTIQDIVRRYSDHGFLDYDGSRKAGLEIQGLVTQADKMVEDGRPDRALPILQAVVETVPEFLNQADDSSGDVGGSISYALQTLEKVAESGDARMRQMVFDYCLEQHNKPQYQGWDYPRELLWQASELVETQAQREALFAALDVIIGRASSHRFDDFEKENALRLKTEVMTRMGDPPEAIHALLLENVHLNQPRQQLVLLYMEQKQYAAARKLCLEAMEMYKGQWPGLVMQYQDLLLQIAQRDDDPEGAVQLAETLLLEGREFDRYYDTLKKYVKPEAWPGFVQKLIRRIDTQAVRWSQGFLLGEIYKREKMWPELLRLAQRDGLEIVERYRKELHQRFPDEMCDLYEKIVLDEMERAGGRERYRELAVLLRRIVDLGDRKRVAEVVEVLKGRYPRRRAMIEELDRL